MLLGWPIALLADCIAIKLDSAGPVFYRAQRIGRKGRTFTCYKFRTMVANADKLKATWSIMNERDGILFKITNDPRITRVAASCASTRSTSCRSSTTCCAAI
jgi:lipopolysaccharide/colanic/teichoic acid biosynthesis glycosyltransferase